MGNLIRDLLGYVTHGGDRVFWAFRSDMLYGDQVETARSWLDAVDKGIEELKVDKVGRDKESLRRVLTLREDRTIGWDDDHRWDAMMHLAAGVLPGEPR